MDKITTNNETIEHYATNDYHRRRRKHKDLP